MAMQRGNFEIPVRGMESVVATVSGYHGTERFNVIKLIKCCGANYVGDMSSNSVTHLVCWQFKGKKYELALKLKLHIISHRWFEDCLKQGRHLPEDPYIMQSGLEVGPITCELPAILEEDVKKSASHFDKKNVESMHYKASHSYSLKGKEIDLAFSNWSDSRLVKEISSEILGDKKCKKTLSNSQSCRKFKRVLELSCQYNKHQTEIIDDCGSWPESSSSPSKRLRRRRNFQDDVNIGVYIEPNDATKITEPMDHESGMKEPNHSSNLVDVTSSEKIQLVTTETNPKIRISVDVRTGSEPFKSGEQKDETKNCDAPRLSALVKQAELSCVICWAEFCSSRGVLPCGHRFCYSCIQEWADCMASRGKVSTCPLCKANFSSITKFEDLATSEQKIFSQTVPCSSSKVDIFCFQDIRYDSFRDSYSGSICFECQHHEPEELLLKCHICQSQFVHSCCLDPPLVKWTCIHCRDSRVLYQRFR